MTGEARSGVVDEDEDGATLAAIVRGLLDGLAWSKARQLVRTGRVQVEGEVRFDPAERVAAGELVEVNPSGRRCKVLPMASEDLVHVDSEVVVVRKPANLLTVPWDGDDERDTLIERTRAALREYGFSFGGKGDKQKSGRAGKSDHLGVVQRLDKDTTGLLVFARNRKVRKALAAQFRAHTIYRRYIALVEGEAEAGIHESALIPDRGDGIRGSWRGANPPAAAKRAVTKVRVEERFAGATLVSCQLETGRQHQIRIHLAEAGHPLIGEPVYIRDYRGERTPAPRPMLHATSLGFRHPANDRLVRFEDPAPDDFRELLESLRQGPR
ncbi:RluA family pseudouridine synthase [Pseudenhygromyxa sp. WMMC2535]|uniref:RluA family pseudouridine synthase n=1 Tax=Pseudenhygromyxa sp. WMMC2535 TaxID=2712867 RepID=UPI001557BDF2|nr:pseudouridine synthase [Pseudenhygromyxa sp. WMMC2535]NVB40930.1 RluA family pseudouridine synthase [Pseudenhygromyxa sp. WMMC2535]